jgi:hypothetical protein
MHPQDFNRLDTIPPIMRSGGRLRATSPAARVGRSTRFRKAVSPCCLGDGPCTTETKRAVSTIHAHRVASPPIRFEVLFERY